MVSKPYDFTGGATLGEHSRQKHKVVRQYFYQYVKTRCQLPQQSMFRLAVVDGFAGGGRYDCGSPGSPIIFIEELQRAVVEINISRAAQDFKPLEIECFLILNDANRDVVELLKENVAPVLASVTESEPLLRINVQYSCEPFEEAYPRIQNFLLSIPIRNVVFNLDQCGHQHVEWTTLSNIMSSFRSAEVFYTFVIGALLTFLQKEQPHILTNQLRPFGFSENDIAGLSDELVTKTNWLGAAERLVFQALCKCAPFVSPFSINNPVGWRYWLVHLANSHRAREVYNNILHDHSSAQAHFGRSGLRMLHYDPKQEKESSLYLFDDKGRTSAREQLFADIPRLMKEFGNALSVSEFYSNIYNMTPAHSDDVRTSIIDNPDLEVITLAGGERRKSHTIALDDTIRLRPQTSFHLPGGSGGSKRSEETVDLSDLRKSTGVEGDD